MGKHVETSGQPARCLRLAVALGVGCALPGGWAQAISIDRDTQLEGSHPSLSYEVSNGATVTGSGTAFKFANLVDQSTLILTSSTVSGMNSQGFALDLTNASAKLTGVTVQSADSALWLKQSQAEINGSSLVGQNIGVTLSTGSEMVLDGSQVLGTDLAGLYMGGGKVVANGSSITGGEFGIVIEDTTGSDVATLELNGTQVDGGTGPAIQVGIPFTGGYLGQAVITLSNGTTLSSGSGELVAVTDGSRATVNVTGSNLEGDLVAGDNAALALSLGQGASLVGNVRAGDNTEASVALADGARFTGRLENVADMSIASGGVWSLVEDTTQQNLRLDGGAVTLGDGSAFRTLSVGNLNGSGGQFNLTTDFATGQTDFVEVTGTSSGSHVLNVQSTGSDASQTHIDVARTADGGADFSLLNGRVDLGTWSYLLASEDGKSWYLDGSERAVSPGAASAMALFNTAPTVWYGELTTLRSRMGELRWRSTAPGAWVRSYGNKFNVATSAGVGYRQQQQGVSLGIDTPLPWGDGQWIAGVLAGYSQSDLDLQRGTDGKVNSYYAGAYATWLDSRSGYYVDALIKANRFRNKADVALSDGGRTNGDYNTLGIGASVEFGRHINLPQGWFVEPYGQLSSLVVQGRDFSLDNGLNADGERAHSLLGKAGATVGRTLELGEGRSVQPYVRAAMVHEFARGNNVTVNGNRFNNDLAGSRAELGTGLAVNFGSRLQANVGFDYAHGDALEQPWGVNAGLRYNW